MKYIILLIIAILPIYLIGLYIYKKDKNKESKKILRKIFLFGVLSCFPACIMELGIDKIFGLDPSNMSITPLFLYYFLVIGLVEEFWKFFVTYKIAYKHPEFDEVYDAVVYLAFAALGFAGFENILYVLSNGITVGIIRAIASVPGHVCYAIIMANYMVLAKKARINNQKKLERNSLIKGIILVSLIHGLFDTCCSGKPFLIVILLFIIIFIYIYSIKKVKKLSRNNEMFVNQDQIVNNNTANNVNINNNVSNFGIDNNEVKKG